MNFIEILYNMHVNLSFSDNPPFTHIKGFDKDKIDLELMNKLSDDNMLKKFSAKCLKSFKKKYPSMAFGSVHHNSVPWTAFAYNAIAKKMNDESKDTTITYPNGCCSKKDCPINLFYDIVHDTILSK